jgi:putative transposase
MAPTPVMVRQLSATCASFAAGCNTALAAAVSARTTNAVAIQKLCYRDIRGRFNLSANLAVRACRRVSAAMNAAKARGRKPIEFKPTSIDYDARIFDYRELDETVSLTVVGGRIHVPIVLGRFQREALTGKKPTSAIVCRKGHRWFIHIVIDEPDAPPKSGPAMGVDMGIRNTAATSNGTLHDGLKRRDYKENRAKIRASLQSRNTRGSRRVLRRLKRREQRRITSENHVLSKSIVSEALKAGSGIIRLERLKGIRERTKIRNRHTNRMMSGWSFGQLQHFIDYKARRAGLAIQFVEPAYTSKTCAKCGSPGTRRQDVFKCQTCGVAHADINAAENIRAGGVASGPKGPRRKPARMEEVESAIAVHTSVQSRHL